MMSEFLDMGGYGEFVWSSYAIWFVVMVINYLQPIIRERKVSRELRKRLKLLK